MGFKNKTAFTLIEILIVVSMVMVITVSMTGVMTGVFNSQNKNEATDKTTQNGNWILNELKKTILNADNNPEKFVCATDYIQVTSVKDQQKTTIKCLGSGIGDYKIASISGKSVGTTVYLFQKNNDLFLNSCSNFISCTTLPSLELSKVIFNFSLGAGTLGLNNGTTNPFSLEVTLRN